MSDQLWYWDVVHDPRVEALSDFQRTTLHELLDDFAFYDLDEAIRVVRWL